MEEINRFPFQMARKKKAIINDYLIKDWEEERSTQKWPLCKYVLSYLESQVFASTSASCGFR